MNWNVPLVNSRPLHLSPRSHGDHINQVDPSIVYYTGFYYTSFILCRLEWVLAGDRLQYG